MLKKNIELATHKEPSDTDFDEVTACVNRAKLFWKQSGSPDRLTQLSPDDVNRFQSAQQQAYIQWLGNVVNPQKGNGK